MATRKRSKVEFNTVTILLIIGAILTVGFFGYVFYRVYQSERTLISIMIIPLILGIVFENRRLSSDWKTIALKIFGSLLLSILAFLPSRNENNYNFENHIEMWPFMFILWFTLASIFFHKKKIIPELTEGITLLQSISIVYWVVDIGFLNFKNVFVYIVMSIGIIFCFVSFVHAFSYIRLTKSARLFLSIWSAIIMVIFAVDHIYRVFHFDHFVDYKMLNDTLNVLQYFLLGVSLIYIFQNAYMLLVYFPDRNSWYGKTQMKDIRQMNETHIKRYSRNQIKIVDSIIALIFTSGIYYWNYQHQIMPRHTIIWLLIWLFPFVIWVKEWIVKRL